MYAFVNGLHIGWKGISKEEFVEQYRVAVLPEIPLGRRCHDLRRKEPYGRLVPLYPVARDREYASHSVRWLCRCSCEKRTLTVVMAHNLVKPRHPTEGCGCIHSIMASANLAVLKRDGEFRKRQAAAASANLRHYLEENPEAVSAHSRAVYQKINSDPEVIARREERFRQIRLSRNLDPDVYLSTYYTRIRHALIPLRRHIMRVRDQFTCALCERRGGTRFAVHHVVPVEVDWSKVGDPRNLVTLCFRCHLKGAHKGYWKTIDPDLQPVILDFAARQEDLSPTPAEIVQIVKERLDVLGREIGRVPCPEDPGEE